MGPNKIIDLANRIEQPMLDYVKNVEVHYLRDSLRYALSMTGKKIRANIIFCIGDYFETSFDLLDYAAIAIEMVHTYSLIHDDLPSMDNDVMRRGKRTLHLEFNEAQAILTGDALQALAFEVLCQTPVDDTTKCKLICSLAKATSVKGLVAGQCLDVYTSDNNITLDIDKIVAMHRAKTGALFIACAEMAAILSNLNESRQDSLRKYAKHLGLAYQIHDDILDITADSKTLNKTANKDTKSNKNTFCKIIGLEDSKKYRDQEIKSAHLAIDWIDRNHLIHQITDYVVSRNY